MFWICTGACQNHISMLIVGFVLCDNSVQLTANIFLLSSTLFNEHRHSQQLLVHADLHCKECITKTVVVHILQNYMSFKDKHV